MNEGQEITRLKGELSACCAVVDLILKIISSNNPDAVPSSDGASRGCQSTTSMILIGAKELSVSRIDS